MSWEFTTKNRHELFLEAMKKTEFAESFSEMVRDEVAAQMQSSISPQFMVSIDAILSEMGGYLDLCDHKQSLTEPNKCVLCRNFRH